MGVPKGRKLSSGKGRFVKNYLNTRPTLRLVNHISKLSTQFAARDQVIYPSWICCEGKRRWLQYWFERYFLIKREVFWNIYHTQRKNTGNATITLKTWPFKKWYQLL